MISGRIRRAIGRSSAVILVSVGLTAAPRSSRAAGFELQTVQTAPAGDRFLTVPDGGVSGDGVFYARLFGSYAYKPLLRRIAGGQTRDLVSSQLYFDAAGAYAIGKRGLVGADLPFVVHQGSNDPASPKDAGLGDLRLVGRLELASVSNFDVGAELRVWLPTGSTDALTGDGALRGSAHLAASGGFGALKYAASLGILARERRELAAAEIGPAVPFSIGAGVSLADDRLFLGPELSGASVVGGHTTFFATRTTPIVALFGARYRVGDVVLGVAGGPGVTNAPGVAPRVVLSVGWEPRSDEAKPEVEPETSPDSSDTTEPATDQQPSDASPPSAPAAPSAEPAATTNEFDTPHKKRRAPPSDAAPPDLTPRPPVEVTPESEQAIRDHARVLFRDGVIAYDKKQYLAALSAFEKAYNLKPHPIVLLNLAQSELMAGQLDAACFNFKLWKETAVRPEASVAKQAAEGIKNACH